MQLTNNPEVEEPQKGCIGYHMVPSAIWNKQARVNFSKTNKNSRARIHGKI